MVISSSDQLIKDECATDKCANKCDGPYEYLSKAQRYNRRGNYCMPCIKGVESVAMSHYVANMKVMRPRAAM